METSNEQDAASLLPSARGYQREMLEQSLKRNIVAALDTGAGKTLIAILRIKAFLEREPSKVAWFLTPTVMLCEQQHDVISKSLPVPTGLISGAMEPNSWKDPSLWQRVLREHRVVVSTPQVLLDAMHHGYINMGQSIGLIVFDEAHHAADKHPYNVIMRNFYFQIYPNGTPNVARPCILGLTASPSFGKDVDRALETIEANLDSVIIAPRVFREELATFVYRPRFKSVLFNPPPYSWEAPPSRNIIALEKVVSTLNIEDDPYVQSLRSQLATLHPGQQRTRVDQKLSKVIQKQDSYTHKGLRDFLRTAKDICYDLGTWPADWFVAKIIEQARATASPYRSILNHWQQREKDYLLDILLRIDIGPVSFDEASIASGISNKVEKLIECLGVEKGTVESLDEAFSGLVFVTRRDSVLALAAVLKHHPYTAGVFSIGCLLGSSDSSYRRAFLDITRDIVKQSQTETLSDFRIGEKNLIISTAVAEEGIDIQACGAVIRMDPPQNMVSWAQSRGRARRKESTFVLMFERDGVHQGLVEKWEGLEAQMNSRYNKEMDEEVKRRRDEHIQAFGDVFNDRTQFRVEETGALLTLDSAVTHLNHFCAILPNGDHIPIYDIDPPDLPEGWHSSGDTNLELYQGPFGATVTLPKLLRPELRIFTVNRIYKSKRLARAHAAFKAYKALYNAKLLNDYLLPLTSTLEPDLEGEVKALLQDVLQRQGTAAVSLQMNPWDPGDDTSGIWKATRISIEGFPTFRVYTRTRPRLAGGEEVFKLHPSDRSPLTTTLSTLEEFDTSDPDILQKARTNTRDIMWIGHGNRMKWDALDFEYLFWQEKEEYDIWEDRRHWWRQELDNDGINSHERDFHADAKRLGARFSYPTDLVVLQDFRKQKTGYRFLSWRSDTLTPEETEEVRAKYAHFKEYEIEYPVLVVQKLPNRVNFLIPAGTKALKRRGEDIIRKEIPLVLLPQFADVLLASPSHINFSLFIPSITRYMAMSITLNSFREKLLLNTPLYAIPPELLMTALTTPVAQESSDYERLETLGDTALKFLVSLQLLSSFPFWHEGYLAKRKDHAVSNAQLAKDAVRLELYRWIIRDRFSPRKWRPAYINQEEVETKSNNPTQKQDLSTKVLADVVEALIGASMVTGDFELAVECAKLFGFGLSNWKSIPEYIGAILDRAEDITDFPKEVTEVEKILGHTFRRPVFLIEALTHSSHQSTLRTTSYERMEFLGDAVLDWIVTDFLYNAPGKEYTPGQMHLRKSAVVNQHILGYVCLRACMTVDTNMPGPDASGAIIVNPITKNVHLFQLLLHSSHRVLDDQVDSFARYQKDHIEIEKELTTGKAFPWAALTRLQAAKFFSDMVESLIGAVFLDTSGDFDAIRTLLRTLGILPLLERIVADDVDVQHPISRLNIWASARQQKVVYTYFKEAGKVTCTVALHEKDEEGKIAEEGTAVYQVAARYRGKRTEMETRFTAAECAMRILDPNPHEELYESTNPFLDLDPDDDDEEEEEDGEEETKPSAPS